MKTYLRIATGMLGACLLAGRSVLAADIIVFSTDFENSSGWTTDPANPVAYKFSVDSNGHPIAWDGGYGGNDDFGLAVTATRTNPTYGGVSETIFASANTRIERRGVVTERNWDIHDGVRNQYVSGYRDYGSHQNHLMSGKVLGHTDNDYDGGELNFYQLDGIDLTSVLLPKLTFDFDSWIQSTEFDGFAVAWSLDGSDSWNLLEPSTDFSNYSEMQYSTYTPNEAHEQKLAAFTGQCPGNSGDPCMPGPLNSEIRGFTGHETIPAGATNPFVGTDPYGNGMDAMAGTAIFDLSTVGQNVVSLRFVFASDTDSTVAEGINIDNILVSGHDSPSGGNTIPEPLTLTLALAGLAFAGLKRRLKN